MPFLLAEILNFQGSTHLIGVGSLSKLLIDKGMKKGNLCEGTDLSSSIMAKMINGESMNLSVLERICEKLDYDFTDLVN